MKKRLLSTLLCLCMALSLLPAPAGAASAGVTDADGLTAAIAAGGEVTLDGDFTVSDTVTIDKAVTLDLSGHTVTAAPQYGYLFQVEEGGQLIIRDSATGGAVRATEPDPDEMDPLTTDLVCINKGGEFWLQGGTLDAAESNAVTIHHQATGASFLMTGGALEGKTALYMRGKGNLAVVTGGSLRGSNYALYVDNASYAYVGGDVIIDGGLSNNSQGALTVAGGTHNGVLYSGDGYRYANVTTALICGGDFHGVWQDDYGELMLYGGSFALDPDGTYSFKTNQTDKTLSDYVGTGATLDPSNADGTSAFSVNKPEGCNPQIVGVFGADHGTVEADGTALDSATRLITDDGAEITATADEGYVSHVDNSKDGVVLVTFLPETPVVTLSWTESGESKSAQLTEREVRYGRTNDYLHDADPDVGASMTFLADTAASLGFEGISPVTLTSDENGPYTLSRDMADGGHSKTGEMLSVGYETSVTVTDLTLDGSVPPAPPYSTESPRFITVDGSLTLGEGATVQNCQPSNYYNAPALPPAAVNAKNGDLTLADGSKIVNNQSRDGGVVKGYNGNVSLSGNVTVKGNVAVDLSDVYSFDPDELAAAPRTTANLVMYKTQQKAAGAPIQVTGALTGGEKSIGLTLLYTEMDPEPTTGKVAAGTANYTLQESDLAAFFSDKPGYFLALNSEENAIYLDEYAITTQPTADAPTVAVNQTKDAAYQWYPTTVVTEVVTDQNASPYQTTKDIDGSDVTVSSSYADDTWTAAIGDWDSGYFTLTLKKGDSLSVTLPTADVPTAGQLGLYDKENYEQLWYYFRDFAPDDGVTAAEDGDNTVITYTVPTDGTYTLMLDGLSAAPAISATVKGVHLGAAVSGQTTATLTADEGGTYLCRVTWSDGTVLDSDVVAYTPPPIPAHTHQYGDEWTSDGTSHWHQCTATDCPDPDGSKKNSAEHTKVYDKDDSQHWEKCSVCGWADTNKANHTGGAASCTAKAVCAACGQSYGNLAAHDFTGDFRSDADGHWHQCKNCTATDAKAAHVYDDDQDATCNTCGYERSVTPPTPSQGDVTGKVEIKGDTPPVTVDEDALKDLAGEVADGDTVTVKLTVEKQDSPADKDDIQSVVTGKKDDVLYLDLSLLKQVNDDAPESISNASHVLEIAVDYDFTGKKDVTVYRKHGDDPAAALDKLTEKPTESFADGSFFADSANGKVYIYASKFSTYAIGYTAETTTPVNPSRPGTSGSGYRWPFVDVKRTDSCYQAVKYAYDNKLMEGTSSTTFDPEGKLTRAMLATVLYRAAGSPEVEGTPEFADTKTDEWYSDAVTWANQTQVLRGYGNGSFGPDDPVSREMLNMIVGRLKGEDPVWTGDPALALPATRAEIAQLLMEQSKTVR